MAETRPLVLVFEDLHFADDGLLDFVDYLVDWATGVPLLAIGTARPELLARRPGWGGGKANASRSPFVALGHGDGADRHDCSTRRCCRQTFSSGCSSGRMATRSTRRSSRGSWPAAGSPQELPETVQGIVAARLDALAPDEKEMLQDASVLGKVFWLGGVAIGEGRTLAARGAAARARAEGVRAAGAPSTMAG